MVAYAAADTMHLPKLRDQMADRLKAAGRMAWAEEEFRYLEDVRWTASQTEDGWLRLKGAKVLPRRSQAVLRSLHQWREQTARALDRAPFRVAQNEGLLAVARAAPRNQSELLAVRGLPPSVGRRYGAQLLAAVAMGLADPLDSLPVPARGVRLKPDAAQEARFERLKALRNQRAGELGLEPGVLCPNGALQGVARVAPQTASEIEGIEDLRRWQMAALGPAAMLAAVAEPAAAQ
jgi:ribonuclease D